MMMTRHRLHFLFRAVLVAVLAQCCAVHSWRTGHQSDTSRSSKSWNIYEVIRKGDLSRISRGGGEQSNAADDKDSTLEQESQPPGATDGSLEDPAQSSLEDGQSGLETLPPSVITSPIILMPHERKVRHTSDVIVRLMEPNNKLKAESIELRNLISNRAQSYVEELSQAQGKLPHPTRVLHFVAPKIPAIKHSPDLLLRVQSFKAGTDTGVAACAIGTVARLCEMYDRRKLQQSKTDEEDFVSVSEAIVRDRRFQQLVECVLCGVDLKKRKQEAEELKEDEMTDFESDARDIEEVLDEEDAEIVDGLSVQDACRAAWGIAVLAGFHTETFSHIATEDILTALSLHTRELLLARLLLLREGETQREDNDGTWTLVERLDQDAEELAQDAAVAMWTFACVKACTGVRSVPLFETCCTILCQNPVDLREHAREDKEGLDGSNFQVNDVIDKLERSEIDHFSTESTDETNATSDSTTNVNVTLTDESEISDASNGLLDWLTPNEVTDVLWALALHGSTVDTDSKEEIALSETAAAFREIAFDRLVGWLNRDLDIVDRTAKCDTDSSAVNIEREAHFARSEAPVDGMIIEQGETTIEVVDAATLLAPCATMETEVVETDVSTHQVQVVDAATLLACTPEVPMEKKTDMLVASTLARSYEPLTEPEENKGGVELPADEPTASLSEGSEQITDMSVLLRSGRLSFSPHDLCSIAWAVTDLRDPLRYLIVDLITQIFSRLGKQSLEDLPMADLSNLAWAIARSASQKQALSYAEYCETPAAVVTRWTAESALTRLEIDGQIIEDHDVALAVHSMLQEFQPPELGRLMWSLSCTVTNHLDPFEYRNQRDAAVSQLAMLALVTAGTNLSIFSTEDLTRIAWAFLELCVTKESLSQPLVAESLGSILAVIESSLLAWESGPLIESASSFTKRTEDTLHFSTFFGKSRFPLLLLNQFIHEQEDDDDGQKTNKKKASLPLLRDLPVDPSSLCKLSSAFSRLCQEQPNVLGGWTFVRVAVRLLSSKNGQLMEQCPLVDVIGLAHACAISEVNGRERGQTVRLFAGRVVQFMNEALDPDPETHGKAAARLARATPWEIAMLMWSLGELGVRYFTSDENRQLAHRKLRLVSERPLLTSDKLESLSAVSMANLIHGMLLMDMLSSDPVFVSLALQVFETKIETLQTGQELVDIAQTVANMRRTVERLEQLFSDGANDDARDEGPTKDNDSDKEKEVEIANGVLTNVHKATIARNAILKSTTVLLTKVSEQATEIVQDLSATEMRELLLVYSTLSFRADAFVDAVDKETHRRLEVLGFTGPSESVQDLARRAFDSSVLASNTLSYGSGRNSKVDTIKHGIQAIFGVHEMSEEASDEDIAMITALADNAKRATTLVRETLGRMEQIRQGAGTDTETLLRGVEQGAAIELGRCQELVAAYRRIDFSTGFHGGRYDSARRRDISKRILSRLFP